MFLMILNQQARIGIYKLSLSVCTEKQFSFKMLILIHYNSNKHIYNVYIPTYDYVTSYL